MKKLIIIAMLLIGCIAQASEFKYYRCKSIESCIQKINELSKTFDIYSYEIVPAYFRKTIIGCGTEIKTTKYDIIIEVGKKGDWHD